MYDRIWILKESSMLDWHTLCSCIEKFEDSIFLNRKSNHIFTIWQDHIVLITIRQYEGKSYRMFVEWLVEAHYLRLFLRLSQIPRFPTLQKFADRISNTLLEKIISSFIIISDTRHTFVRIDSQDSR